MKTLNTKFVMISLLLAGSVSAQTNWVETAFWKAPQVKNFTIKLNGKEKLARECSTYKKAVFNEDGSLTIFAKEPRTLARFRRPIDAISFDLGIKTWDRVEKSIVADENNPSNKNLPHFVQKEATTGILLGDATNITMEGNGNSYTEVSKNLGLEKTEIQITTNHDGNFVMIVSGLDVACDLYEGRGQLVATVPSYVVLGEEGYEKLDAFYNKRLIPEIKDLVNSKTETLLSKATRIGYRTGKVIEEEFTGISAKETDKSLHEVLKTLFHPKTLDMTSQLIRSGSEIFVKLEDRVEAQPSQVTLEF